MSEGREPARWERIQERGMNDVIIGRCLDAWACGAIDKVGALEEMVLALSTAYETAIKEVSMPPPLVLNGSEVLIYKTTEQALLSAGWLPPSEGRKVLEGLIEFREIHRDCDGYYLNGDVLELPTGRYRLIIDPLEEEGEGEGEAV